MSSCAAVMQCCTVVAMQRWLFGHAAGAPAPIYILANAAVASALVTVPYRLLIEFTTTALVSQNS
jgi:hypothetical protein